MVPIYSSSAGCANKCILLWSNEEVAGDMRAIGSSASLVLCLPARVLRCRSNKSQMKEISHFLMSKTNHVLEFHI